MSRSSYSDDLDQWDLIKWRGQVASIVRGKRGQAFLLEMLAALDALPDKKLIADELEDSGQVCAIGAVGKARGIDMAEIDPHDYEQVASRFEIKDQLAQEIVYQNDEVFLYARDDKGYIKRDLATGKLIEATPEERFVMMRAWIVSLILPVPIEDSRP